MDDGVLGAPSSLAHQFLQAQAEFPAGAGAGAAHQAIDLFQNRIDRRQGHGQLISPAGRSV